MPHIFTGAARDFSRLARQKPRFSFWRPGLKRLLRRGVGGGKGEVPLPLLPGLLGALGRARGAFPGKGGTVDLGGRPSRPLPQAPAPHKPHTPGGLGSRPFPRITLPGSRPRGATPCAFPPVFPLPHGFSCAKGSFRAPHPLGATERAFKAGGRWGQGEGAPPPPPRPSMGPRAG